MGRDEAKEPELLESAGIAVESERRTREENALGFEILRALRRIIRRVSRHSREIAADTGLTLPQLICLKAAAEGGAERTTVSEIGKTVSLSAATVSRIVDKLVRKGLVERHRWESDRRKVYVELTAAGMERYLALPAPLDERFLERLAEMPPEDCAALLESLRRIVALMDAKDEDAAPLLVEGVHVESD